MSMKLCVLVTNSQCCGLIKAFLKSAAGLTRHPATTDPDNFRNLRTAKGNLLTVAVVVVICLHMGNIWIYVIVPEQIFAALVLWCACSNVQCRDLICLARQLLRCVGTAEWDSFMSFVPLCTPLQESDPGREGEPEKG